MGQLGGEGGDPRGPKLQDDQFLVSPAVFPFVLTLYPLEPGLAVHEVIQPVQAYALAQQRALPSRSVEGRTKAHWSGDPRNNVRKALEAKGRRKQKEIRWMDGGDSGENGERL